MDRLNDFLVHKGYAPVGHPVQLPPKSPLADWGLSQQFGSTTGMLEGHDLPTLDGEVWPDGTSAPPVVMTKETSGWQMWNRLDISEQDLIKLGGVLLGRIGLQERAVVEWNGMTFVRAINFDDGDDHQNMYLVLGWNADAVRKRCK